MFFIPYNETYRYYHLKYYPSADKSSLPKEGKYELTLKEANYSRTFFVVKERKEATPCGADYGDLSCVFADRNITFEDATFATCVNYNRFLMEKNVATEGAFLTCCEGADLSCEGQLRPNGEDALFTAEVDEENKLVSMKVNRPMDMRFISEKEYTCRCSFQSTVGRGKEKKAVLVSFQY